MGAECYHSTDTADGVRVRKLGRDLGAEETSETSPSYPSYP